MRSSRRMIALSVSLVLLAAAAVAVLMSGNASARPAGGTISLVAYSTPRDAYGALDPGFPDTPAGNGTPSSRATEPRASRRARSIAGLKADVVDFSLEPDMTRSSKRASSTKTWNERAVPRHRHALGRRVRRAQGQPEAHPHLGRPDQARRGRRHAERPASGGAKWNVMAAYGAQRRIGTHHAGASSTSRSFTTTSSRRTRARARRSRRSSRAAATCSSPTRTRRSSRRSRTSRSTT